MTKYALALLLAAAPLGRPAAAGGSSVVGSKHDLSVAGPGVIHATSERNPCAFCHISHTGGGRSLGRPDIAPIHVPYESSTMAHRPGAPSGSSRVCLSCHDGTIAVGQTKSRRISTTHATIPADRPSNLGTDLRKSHPVSFRPAAGGTRPPPPQDAVALDRNGELQCTSCHDPHSEFGGDPAVGMFLVKSARDSELCLTCHDPATTSPADGSHARATATAFAAHGIAPGRTSVGAAGCRACHRSHGADPGGRILDKSAGDDDGLCLRCHDGTVARRNVSADWAKPYAHGGQARGVHDAAEGRPGAARALPERSPAAQRHATCADCHEPHAAGAGPAPGAPAAGPVLQGVWGIDEFGQRVERVQFEYEVCFKCHGDSTNQPQGRGARPVDTVRRASTDTNLRRQLSRSAASFHPIVGPGRNPDVPSLRAPYSTSSVVYCTDCHASDSGPGAGGAGPRGPHGSVYPALLERNYSTRDLTAESPAAYALCYKCHDRDVLLSQTRSAFALHRRHVVGASTPCSACHASHGVSTVAGNPDANAHLIDFDVSIVAPAQGARWYRSTGARHGSCNLTCHGKTHDPSSAAY